MRYALRATLVQCALVCGNRLGHDLRRFLNLAVIEVAGASVLEVARTDAGAPETDLMISAATDVAKIVQLKDALAFVVRLPRKIDTKNKPYQQKRRQTQPSKRKAYMAWSLLWLWRNFDFRFYQ